MLKQYICNTQTTRKTSENRDRISQLTSQTRQLENLDTMHPQQTLIKYTYQCFIPFLSQKVEENPRTGKT